MTGLRCVVARPGCAPVVEVMASAGLADMRAMFGAGRRVYLEHLYSVVIERGLVSLFVDEDACMTGAPPNRTTPQGVTILGPILACAFDSGGGAVSMSDAQIVGVLALLDDWRPA